jgi:hypothetical protein
MRTTAGTAALSVLLAVACADTPPPSDGSGAIEHPRGSDEVVLRISHAGGFVPIEWTLTSFPTFTLYGDGTVITGGPQIAIHPPPALPAIVTRTLTEEGIEAIVRAAIDAGLGSRDIDATDTGRTMIADAATTTFTLTADGRTTTASVYALGGLTERPSGMSDEEWGLRSSLARFAERLTGLEDWLPAGSIRAEGAYRATSARLYVGPYQPQEDLPQQAEPWPLGDLATFGMPTSLPDVRCGVVVGEDWHRVRQAAGPTNQLTPWTSGGQGYLVWFRPLLPDERGC